MDESNQQSKKLLSLFYTDVRVELRAGQDIRQFALTLIQKRFKI